MSHSSLLLLVPPVQADGVAEIAAVRTVRVQQATCRPCIDWASAKHNTGIIDSPSVVRQDISMSTSPEGGLGRDCSSRIVADVARLCTIVSDVALDVLEPPGLLDPYSGLALSSSSSMWISAASSDC